MKNGKITIDKDKFKNGIIIILILIIVFGSSFMATQIGEGHPDQNDDLNNISDTEVVNNLSKVEEESASIREEEQSDLEEINIDRYLKIKEGSSPNVIYIARPTCHYCEIQNPIIRNIAYQYHLNIYYLNTNEMSAEESSTFIKSDDNFKTGFGTPCTIIVKDDKVIGKINGLADSQTIIDFFISNGIISE